MVTPSASESRRTVLPGAAESGRTPSSVQAASGVVDHRRTASPNTTENRRAVSPNTTENQRTVTPSAAEHVRVAPDAAARDVLERRRSSVESALRAEAAEAIGEPILRRGENRARAVEVPDIAMPARPRRTAAPEALERPLSPSEGRRTRSTGRAPSRGAEDGYTPLDSAAAAASDAPVPRRVDIGTGDDCLARYDDPDYVARRLQERNAPKGPET